MIEAIHSTSAASRRARRATGLIVGTALFGSLILGIVDVRAATGAAQDTATASTLDTGSAGGSPTSMPTTVPPAGSTLTTAAQVSSTQPTSTPSTTAPVHHDLVTPIETHLLPSESTSTLANASSSTSTPTQLASASSSPTPTPAPTTTPTSVETTSTTVPPTSTKATNANPEGEPGFDDVRAEPTTTMSASTTTVAVVGPPVPAVALERWTGSGRRELRAGLFVTASEPVLAALTVDMEPSPNAATSDADHQAFALRVENVSTYEVPAPVVLEFGYEGFEPIGSFAGDSSDNAWACSETDERLRCVHDQDIEAAAVSVITVRTTVSGGPGTARTAAVYVLVLLVGLLASIINARSDSNRGDTDVEAEALAADA